MFDYDENKIIKIISVHGENIYNSLDASCLCPEQTMWGYYSIFVRLFHNTESEWNPNTGLQTN